MRPPFSWLCHQGPLPWRGDQLLVVSYRYMPMDLIGWLMMRPPILQLGLDLLFFHGSLCFLLRSFLLLSRGSLGEASQGVILLVLIFCQLLLPSGPLAPSSHKVRYNPYIFGQPNARINVKGWMSGKKMKSGKYCGNGQ
jgi:hypothetical protein